MPWEANTDARSFARKEVRAAIMGRIWSERDRQDVLWPEQAPGQRLAPPDPKTMLAVLTEEVGEVAKAILEADDDELRTELVQTAAVCVKWLELMDPLAAPTGNAEASDRELGAAITDPGDDGSGWG